MVRYAEATAALTWQVSFDLRPVARRDRPTRDGIGSNTEQCFDPLDAKLAFQLRRCLAQGFFDLETGLHGVLPPRFADSTSALRWRRRPFSVKVNSISAWSNRGAHRLLQVKLHDRVEEGQLPYRVGVVEQAGACARHRREPEKDRESVERAQRVAQSRVVFL